MKKRVNLEFHSNEMCHEELKKIGRVYFLRELSDNISLWLGILVNRENEGDRENKRDRERVGDDYERRSEEQRRRKEEGLRSTTRCSKESEVKDLQELADLLHRL